MDTGLHNQARIPKWSLGDRLAKARRSAAISVAQMADELDVDPKTVNNYEKERSKRGVPRALVMAYSLRTGVPRWWIEGGPPPEDSAVTDPLTSGYPLVTWWEEAA